MNIPVLADHAALEPVPGDPWVVREEARLLVSGGQQLAQVAMAVSRMSPEEIAATKERSPEALSDGPELTAGGMIRMCAINMRSGTVLLRYSDELQAGQEAANTAIEQDAVAHQQFEALRVRAVELERQTLTGAAPGNTGTSTSEQDELSRVCAQMTALIEAEEDHRRKHSEAVQRVNKAADTSTAAIQPLTIGPSAFEIPLISAPITSIHSAHALAVGVLCAGIIGQAVAERPSEAPVGRDTLNACAAQLEELSLKPGKDPAFYQGMLGERTQTADFLEFLDHASRSQDTQLRDVAAALASGARAAFPTWTATLPVQEQERIGRDLIKAVNRNQAGHEAFAAYLLTGGPPERVVFGSLTAVRALVRNAQGETDPYARNAALRLLADCDAGDPGSLAEAVSAQAATHPRLAPEHPETGIRP